MSQILILEPEVFFCLSMYVFFFQNYIGLGFSRDRYRMRNSDIVTCVRGGKYLTEDNILLGVYIDIDQNGDLKYII